MSDTEIYQQPVVVASRQLRLRRGFRQNEGRQSSSRNFCRKRKRSRAGERLLLKLCWWSSLGKTVQYILGELNPVEPAPEVRAKSQVFTPRGITPVSFVVYGVGLS